MKPKLVILNIYQLGYHTDTYNYCIYLKNDFDITYVSFHQGFDDISIQGIQTITHPQPRGFWRLIQGYFQLAKNVKKVNPDIIFLVYARLISIVKLFFPKGKYILDIRTGSVIDHFLKRKFWNFIIWMESLSFKDITIISEGLQKMLNLPFRKCHLLPLGGNKRNFKIDFSKLNLLYLGVFDQRNIQITIEGLAIFRKKNPTVSIHYNIVGYGKPEIEKKIKETIFLYEMENDVTYNERVPYDQIDYYLKKSSIGIVYVPVTSYYNYQPSTKLFEFILAGFPVLATATVENKKIVNDSNGILIDENPDAFSIGLEQLYEKISTFNEDIIRNSVLEYCWENIVDKHLKFLLLSKIHY